MINKLLRDKKNTLILLLSALVAIALPRSGLPFLLWIVTGIAAAAGSDFLIKSFFLKQRVFSKSAIISGFIVGGVLDYRQPLWGVIAFAVLAIISKYAIKFKGRHIFNPANFGLFVAALAGIPLAWNIESNIYLILAAGIYIAYAMKKLPHVCGFLTVFAVLFAAQGLNPLALVSWFFVFVMLIEPKTSGSGKLRGAIFGAATGAVAFVIYKLAPQYDLFVGALFAVNLLNPLLDKIKTRREK